jgi:hypothetical protein
MPFSQPPPLPSPVSTGERETRVSGRVGAGTNRKMRTQPGLTAANWVTGASGRHR